MKKRECSPTLEKMGASLLSLMQEHPFERITIDQITERAGTGRVTYFRNFSSKADLLSYYMLCQYKHYYAEHGGGRGIHEMSRDSLLCLFRFCEAIREEHMLIVNSGQEGAIYMAYKYSFMEKDESDWATAMQEAFLNYGLLGVIHEWIRKGCSPSAEEMVDRLLSFINFI